MTTPARILLAASLAAIGAAALTAPPALAQQQAPAKPPAKPPAGQAEAPAPEAKEVALTQAQIDGLIAAQAELAKLPPPKAPAKAPAKTPAKPPAKPDPKAQAEAQAQIEAIAKKNGFPSLDAFQEAGDSVEGVLEGIDPETKTYVGVPALLRKQLAAIEADKAMPAKPKAAAVKEIKAALAAGEPDRPSDGNIALVTQNYDKLSAALGQDDEKK